MSTQFYSVPTGTQSAMGGAHLHTPQSVFQHAMNHQGNNEAQWLGMPQVPPMSMPWVISSSQQPDLVYFTGRQKSCAIGERSFKRKLETPDLVDMRPSKQLITEEKMTQHFKGLYISGKANTNEAGSSTINSIQNLEQSSCVDVDLTNSLDSNDGSSEPRLVISDELKRLQDEPILPSSLLTQSLSKLERPSMALVLWEPPSKHLRIFSRNIPTPIPSDDDNNGNSVNTANMNNNTFSSSLNNNNNESIPDFNQTVEVNPMLEPMDF